MACNRDENCRDIAIDYQNALGELSGDFSSLNSTISDIDSELGELNVPNDYLGNKINEKLGEIRENFASYIGNIDSVKSSVIGFVNDKKSEHRKHYDDWRRQNEDALTEE